MAKRLSLSKIQAKKVIAVGAHPDDLEVSAGGTLALLSKANQVTIVVATDGGAGTHDRRQKIKQLRDKRKMEAIEAAKILGSQRIVFLDYPDLQLRRYHRSFFKDLLKLMLKEKPDIVITWDYWGKYELYIHPDHRTTAEAVMEVILESTLPSRLRQWDISKARPLDPKPELWLMSPGEPNFVVDITQVFKKKQKALAQHKSQISTIMKYTLLEHRLAPGRAPKYREPFRILET